MSTQVEPQEEPKKELKSAQENFKDLLDRKKLAKNFVSVLKSQDANVFSINGGWGTGKTWFLKFVEEECKIQKIPFVQYNVWENDYCDFPFQAIVTEIINLLKKYHPSESQEIIEMEGTVTKILEFLAPFATLIKFDTSKITSVSSYKDFKDLKNKFIDSLIKCLDKNQEIVIAIDELDRCRPDYAIRTLEIIKHFFNIKGIKFILAVDKGQLANTVKALYGQDANTDCYLRKFVDLEYTLPETNKKDFISYLLKEKHKNIYDKIQKAQSQSLSLVKSENRESYGLRAINDNDLITKFIAHFENFDYKLRDIEKFFIKLDIVFNLLDFEQSTSPDILALDILIQLLILNSKYPELYNKLGGDANFRGRLKGKEDGLFNNFRTLDSTFTIIEQQYFSNDYIETTDFQYNLKRCARGIHNYLNIINFSEGFE